MLTSIEAIRASVWVHDNGVNRNRAGLGITYGIDGVLESWSGLLDRGRAEYSIHGDGYASKNYACVYCHRNETGTLSEVSRICSRRPLYGFNDSSSDHHIGSTLDLHLRRLVHLAQVCLSVERGCCSTLTILKHFSIAAGRVAAKRGSS